MKLVDVNLTLYAVNRDASWHEPAREWLETTLCSEEPVALPWVVLLGFVRISTNPRIFPSPLPPNHAIAIVDGWLAQPAVTVVHPGPDHWRLLKSLVAESGTAGNLTTDAHLAALAIEHGAELCSTDQDFGRFAKLRWTNPLAD